MHNQKQPTPWNTDGMTPAPQQPEYQNRFKKSLLDFTVERCFQDDKEEEEVNISKGLGRSPMAADRNSRWRQRMAEEVHDIVCMVLTNVLSNSPTTVLQTVISNAAATLEEDVLPRKWTNLENLANQFQHLDKINPGRRGSGYGNPKKSATIGPVRRELLRGSSPNMATNGASTLMRTPVPRMTDRSSPLEQTSSHRSASQENLPLKKRKSCDSPNSNEKETHFTTKDESVGTSYHQSQTCQAASSSAPVPPRENPQSCLSFLLSDNSFGTNDSVSCPPMQSNVQVCRGRDSNLTNSHGFRTYRQDPALPLSVLSLIDIDHLPGLMRELDPDAMGTFSNFIRGFCQDPGNPGNTYSPPEARAQRIPR